MPRHILGLIAIFILVLPVAAQSAEIGQQVRLAATHELGVPMHREPRPSMFDRAPDQTVARVLAVGENGRWLEIALADGRTGWIVDRYVAAVVPGDDIPIPVVVESVDGEHQVWESAQACEDAVTAGHRMGGSRSDRGDRLRLATWNIRWFPNGSLNPTPESRTDLAWLACTLAWMDADVVALQEILTTAEAEVAWEAVLDGLHALTGDEWAVGFQECGSPNRQHTGFLWNASRVELTDPADLWELNGAAEGASQPCAAALRPGHYRYLKSRNGGADLHIVSVHLDSGRTARDRGNRDRAVDRIDDALAPVFGRDQDAIILGDFNSMGTDDPPSTGEEEIGLIAARLRQLVPGFELVPAQPACSEYFEGHGGLLDHIVVAQSMQEADQRSARVTGYCALAACAPLRQLPAAAEKLSDHCPVLMDIADQDLD